MNIFNYKTQVALNPFKFSTIPLLKFEGLLSLEAC